LGLADLDQQLDPAAIEVPEFEAQQIVAVEIGLVELRAGVRPELGDEGREVDAGELALRIHTRSVYGCRKEVSLRALSDALAGVEAAVEREMDPSLARDPVAGEEEAVRRGTGEQLRIDAIVGLGEPPALAVDPV